MWDRQTWHHDYCVGDADDDDSTVRVLLSIPPPVAHGTACMQDCTYGTMMEGKMKFDYHFLLIPPVSLYLHPIARQDVDRCVLVHPAELHEGRK